MSDVTAVPPRRRAAAVAPPSSQKSHSPFIDLELQSRGVAQVIVVLTPGAAAGMVRPAGAPPAGARLALSSAAPSGVQSLASLFTSSEHSAATAILNDRAQKRSPQLSLRAAAAAQTAGTNAVQPVRYYPNLGVMLGTVDRAGLEALKDRDEVQNVVGSPQLRLIRPKRVGVATAVSGSQWGVKKIDAPALWKKGFDGSGVVVAHLDTGVDGSHAALRDAITQFMQFDDLGAEVTPSPKAFDSDQHGTHTAGTIAGRPVNGKLIGIAPGASLASALVIEGGDAVARVLGGMNWAVGVGARVISMSLGFPGFVEDFLAITQILRSRGVLPVFAAGNEGPGFTRSPGNYSEALSVGAIDKTGTIASFSSSQNFNRPVDAIVPDVVGPGVDIVSAKPGGGYQSMDGTSMATPHIAGLAALLFSAKPQATVDDVESAIFGSCTRPTKMDPQRGGRGIPNAVKALSLL
jgi:subtilisin